jgi:hypothetical protein
VYLLIEHIVEMDARNARITESLYNFKNLCKKSTAGKQKQCGYANLKLGNVIGQRSVTIVALTILSRAPCIWVLICVTTKVIATSTASTRNLQ